MIKVIFFDNGGVLCEEGYTSGIKRYEQEFKIPDGEFYKIVHDHQGWKNYTLGLISQAEYFELCQQRSGGHHLDEKKFLDHIGQSIIPNFELIKYIKELSFNFDIGIISNNPKEMFEQTILKIGLGEAIKYKIISCYTHFRKPDKRMFQMALDQAGVKAEESVYVDDRPDRIDGAKELGMQIIIYKNSLSQFKNDLQEAINKN